MRDSRVGKTKTITSGGNTERHGEGREKSQCELKAGTVSSPQSPGTTPPPSRANCGKEGVQVESATTQRTQNQKLGERGLSLGGGRV